jgi:protein kinase-like protein
VPLVSGSRLGHYEVLAPLGAGGMGEVYRARDTRLDRTVAVKVLPAAFATDLTLRARFGREAHAISVLSHPHICTVHDLGEEGGQAYLVMEHTLLTIGAQRSQLKIRNSSELLVGEPCAERHHTLNLNSRKPDQAIRRCWGVRQ